MNYYDLKAILEKQKHFFNSNETKSIEFRKAQLQKLLTNLNKYEQEFCDAFDKDLKKPKAEFYMTEFGSVISVIKDMLKILIKEQSLLKFVDLAQLYLVKMKFT